MSGDAADRADEALAGLATADVDDAVSARIRRRGHVALKRGARLAKTPGLARLDRAYHGVIEPALVGVASVVYLAWAVFRALHLI